MNTTQVKYFITAARVLNFTEAAKKLYISQPALSKQITAIENELNMMLFIRDKKSVRLTPAGMVLLKELPKWEDQYCEIIRKAKIANEGNAGALSIGMLEGQMLGQEFTTYLANFSEKYPNISVRLIRDSFSGLRKKLEDKEMDLAFSLDFDVSGTVGIEYREIMCCPACAAVSKNHPLACKEITSWSDLKGQTFIAISEDDCFASARMIEEDCKKVGFHPIIKYAPSLETAMLWIEAGLGVGFVNSMNNLTMNPNVVLLDRLPYNNTHTVMCWSNDNYNPSIALFRNYIENKLENR